MKIIFRNSDIKFEKTNSQTLEPSSIQTNLFLNDEHASYGESYSVCIYDVTGAKSLIISKATARSNKQIGLMANADAIPESKVWTSSTGTADWSALFTEKMILLSPNANGTLIPETSPESFSMSDYPSRTILLVQYLKDNPSLPVVVAKY